MKQVALRDHAVQKFDPKKTKQRDAKFDALIEYANRVKDWPLLEQAVEAKIQEQREFVTWWEKEITSKWGKGKRI